MSQSKNISVEINGNKTKIIDLELKQYSNKHHSFNINVSGSSIGNEDGFISADEIYELIGRVVIIKIDDPQKADDKFEFEGYIASVSLSQYKGTHDNITLSGFAPTKVVDDTRSMATFTEKTIEEIAKAVLGPVSKVLAINIPNDPQIGYCTQYNETPFRFIARLAAKYGLWFYYEGRKLIIGEYHEINTITLKSGVTLDETIFNMRMIPINQSLSHYDYMNHDRMDFEDSDFSLPKADKYFNTTMDASKNMHTQENSRATRELIETERDLKDFGNAQIGLKASQMLSMEGESQNPGIHIGTKIEVLAKDGKTVGNYYVVKVVHQCDGQGHYSNSFKAFPAQLKAPIPSSLVKIPRAAQQIAGVTANDDPEGLGRLRVQFPWQDRNEQTPWIRYMFPYAGQNRGSYWLPELKDQVLVGFEFDNPDRPIVLGSLFHGESAPEHHNKDNTVKVIGTKSNKRIEFHEGDHGKILISSGSGNEIELQNSSISDDEGIILITAKSEAGLYSDKVIEINSEGEIIIFGSNKITIETDDLSLKGSVISIEASDALNLKGGTVNIEGQQSAGMKGAQVTIDGSATTAISGGLITLN